MQDFRWSSSQLYGGWIRSGDLRMPPNTLFVSKEIFERHESVRITLMRYLSWLEKTVGDQLSGDQVGKPVFVRAHLELTADHGLLIPISEAGVSLARRWLGAGVRSIYALGGVQYGTLSLQVEFAQGQTALLSAELTHGGESSVQLLCVGQHGTLRFDDFPDPVLLMQPIQTPKPGYRGYIERSLASGRPVRAAED